MSIQQNFVNIKPSLNLDFANTKQLDPRITFARASTARFYDGKTTAKAEENLVTFSQEFDNAAWSKSATTVTANTTAAPNATVTADTATSDGTTTQHSVSASPSLTATTTYAFSVYAKAASTNFLQITTNLTAGSANHYANFNLQTGVVSAVGSSATGSIEAVGDGWYRCTAVMTTVSASASVTFILAPIDSGTATRNPSFSAVTSVFLWGAQLEQRSSVTAYTPTTTAPITNYIPVLQTAAAGTPRFDHNPVTGESLGLLIEEQRTNLALQSGSIGVSPWGTLDYTFSATKITAPDGQVSGVKAIAGTGNSIKYISQAISTVASTTYTWSVYAKAAEYNTISLYFISVSAPFEHCTATFNLSTGVVSGGLGSSGGTFVSATATPIGNGWWRLTMTGSIGAKTNMESRLYPNSFGAFTGDGTSGVYLWGAQLEAGAFATSYIPTVQSQVTRATDSASITGSNFSSWYNVNAGTLYAEGSTEYSGTPAATRVLANIRSTDDANRISIRFGSNASERGGSFFVFSNSTTSALINEGSALVADQSMKFAGAYAVNDFAFAKNSVLVGTDTSGTLSVGVTELQLGAGNLCGNIKRLAYYPIRCTNTQLQALTS
jgi:hypothetical protein